MLMGGERFSVRPTSPKIRSNIKSLLDRTENFLAHSLYSSTNLTTTAEKKSLFIINFSFQVKNVDLN